MATSSTVSTSVAVTKFSLENDKRDIKDLWNDALKDYKTIVGKELQSTFQNTEDMLRYAINQQDTFHKWRHDGKKLDKVRSLFMQNIGFIESGAQKLIAAATPAFPPAAAIGTALTFVLAACKGQSADYDVVTSFFEDMNNFLHRITILEGRLPAHRAYQACLMDVFTAVLKMCAFATKFISKGRFKTWIINSFMGQDADLSSARMRMDKNIDRLKEATGMAILANTQGLKGGQHELSLMQAELSENQSKQNELIQAQSQLLGTIQQSQIVVQDGMDEVKTGVQALLAMMKPKEDVSTLSAHDPMPQGSNPVKTFLNINTTDIEARINSLRQTRVANTGEWLFQHSIWKSWSATPDRGLLLLQGPMGVGKSHLATAAYDRLYEAAKQDPHRYSIVTHFIREPGRSSTNTFSYFISWIVLQISEQNPVLRDRFSHKFAAKKEADQDGMGLSRSQYLQELIAPSFSQDSKFQLYIVIDGIDDLEFRARFTDILESISGSALRIKILRTMRSTPSEVMKHPPNLKPSTSLTAWALDVSRDDIRPDIKLLIHDRMQEGNEVYAGLAHLNSKTRNKIAEHVEEKASTLLYIEFALRYLSGIRREGAILRELKTGLAAESSILFEQILQSCKRRLPQDLVTSVQSLLIWLTYSLESLDLDESNQIVWCASQDENIRVEEEIEHVFGRILQIGPTKKARYRPDNLDDALNPPPEDVIDDDGDLVVSLRDPCMKEFLLDLDIASWDQAKHEVAYANSNSHRSIFLRCCQILASRESSNEDTASHAGAEKLREYAAAYCLRHWQSIDCDQHEYSANLEVCHALYHLLADRRGHLASKLDALYGLPLNHIVKRFDTVSDEDGHQTFSRIWQRWSKSITDHASDPPRTLCAMAQLYWRGFYRDAFQPLFEAVMERWLDDPSQRDIDPLFASYYTAIAILPYESGVTPHEGENCFDDQAFFSRAYEAKTVHLMRALYHRPLTSTGHLATARILRRTGAAKDAHVELMAATEKCSDRAQKAQIYIELSRTCRELGIDNDDLTEEEVRALDRKNCAQALAHLDSAIELSPEEASDTRISALFQRIQVLDSLNARSGMREIDREIVDMFQEIRPYSRRPLVHNQNLIFEEMLYYESHHDHMMDFVVGLTPTQRLSLFIYPPSVDRSEFARVLLPAAVRVKRVAELQDLYYRILEDLNLQNYGITWYAGLVRFHRATGSLDAVSPLLGKAFAYTFERPVMFVGDLWFDASTVVEDYINLAADVFYHQFRCSNQPDAKTLLLHEVEAIPLKPLSQNVQMSTTSLVPYLMVLARMQKRIGSWQKYQETLQQAFDICWANLHDDVISNDLLNMRHLAKVLALGPCLVREAEMVSSAQLYYLGKLQTLASNNHVDGAQEASPEYSTYAHLKEIGVLEDDTLPPKCTRAHDIEKCPVGTDWPDWEEPMYICRCCTNSILCQFCYDERIRRNASDGVEDEIDFCCDVGEYIRTPMAGWEGIRDGIIYIEDEEPIEFGAFLAQLREKWKQSWDDFWQG